jgi:hypothetical protein
MQFFGGRKTTLTVEVQTSKHLQGVSASAHVLGTVRSEFKNSCLESGVSK